MRRIGLSEMDKAHYWGSHLGKTNEGLTEAVAGKVEAGKDGLGTERFGR